MSLKLCRSRAAQIMRTGSCFAMQVCAPVHVLRAGAACGYKYMAPAPSVPAIPDWDRHGQGKARGLREGGKLGSGAARNPCLITRPI